MERAQSDVKVTVDNDQGVTTVRSSSTTAVGRQLADDATPTRPLSSDATLTLPELGAPTTQTTEVVVQVDEPTPGPSHDYQHDHHHPCDHQHHFHSNTYFLRSICRRSGQPTCLLDNFFADYKPDLTHYYGIDFGMYLAQHHRQPQCHQRPRRQRRRA